MIALEISGPLGTKTSNFLRFLGHRLTSAPEDPRKTVFLFQRIIIIILIVRCGVTIQHIPMHNYNNINHALRSNDLTYHSNSWQLPSSSQYWLGFSYILGLFYFCCRSFCVFVVVIIIIAIILACIFFLTFKSLFAYGFVLFDSFIVYTMSVVMRWFMIVYFVRS